MPPTSHALAAPSPASDHAGAAPPHAARPGWGRRFARLLARLEQALGGGAVMTLDRLAAQACAGPLGTGLPALDHLLGAGLPRGAIVELAGPAASGKTSLALQCVAAAQAEGIGAAFIDVERATHPAYARALGCDGRRTLWSRPADAEQALELAEALARGGEVGLVVLDSLPALLPRQEREARLDLDVGAVQARLLARGLRRLAAAAVEGGCCLLLVNQERARHQSGDDDEAPAGGHALAYYASARLRLRRAGLIGPAAAPEGEQIAVALRKSRACAPGRSARLALRYGAGFQPGGWERERGDAATPPPLPA